uniref:Uncharacterized protein n=1 Tax=Arcella intermedia TaxID=1963864 RepID=A0A6B2L833_9EUKA
MPLEISVDTPNYKLRVGGDGLKSGRIGHPAPILLKVLDKKTKKPVTLPPEKISLKSKGPGPLENLRVKAAKKLPGTYAILYSTETPGTYDLSVVVDKDETKTYPVEWHSTPVSSIPTDPHNVDVLGLDPVVAKDVPVNFTLVANDAHGKHKPVGGDPFDVIVTSPEGDRVPTEVKDLGNGEYDVSFTPDKEGPLDVSVAFAGVPVTEAPLHLEVTPDGFEPLSEVSVPIPFETSKYKLVNLELSMSRSSIRRPRNQLLFLSKHGSQY